MAKLTKKQKLLARRKTRVRQKVSGTKECPRMTVFRSLNHLYVQVIDDAAGHTLAAASTLDKEIKEFAKSAKPMELAKRVGERAAELCAQKNITSVVFDRNGRQYHGRLAAVATGAREKGLQF